MSAQLWGLPGRLVRRVQRVRGARGRQRGLPARQLGRLLVRLWCLLPAPRRGAPTSGPEALPRPQAHKGWVKRMGSARGSTPDAAYGTAAPGVRACAAEKGRGPLLRRMHGGRPGWCSHGVLAVSARAPRGGPTVCGSRHASQEEGERNFERNFEGRASADVGVNMQLRESALSEVPDNSKEGLVPATLRRGDGKYRAGEG